MPKSKKTGISASVIKRLPRYYRFIGELVKQGVVRSSSGELAEKMSLTASQIRQDLNCFGGFGQQGYGYNLVELRKEIGKILGVDKGYKTVLFGAGNLGKAIASHMNFKEYGCELIGIFDSDANKCGETVAGLEIMPVSEMESFFEAEKPQAAVLCIPKASAQELADKLIAMGIKAFWNFSHYDLKVTHKDIIVENAHLGDSIMMLSYGLTNSEEQEDI
ncbi:MAG: redox-sensing transcriptional repressor Rex [Oscillospiraceae bacterium]|nr:redox-sensing transcriptional repressor Rex [Oscillospiraceae bacterium]